MSDIRADARAELLSRVERDQVARRAMDWDAIRAVDEENLPWLKQLIAEVGWPGQSLVGDDGAHAAWLLVQHADSDPVFQRQCLDLLTEAADRGEATSREVAYLTDRVLLHEGKPQEFGTQAMGRDGRYVAQRLRDPEGVDERRARAGLGPLDEYLDGMLTHFGPPPPTQLICPACQTVFDETFSANCPGCGMEIAKRIVELLCVFSTGYPVAHTHDK